MVNPLTKVKMKLSKVSKYISHKRRIKIVKKYYSNMDDEDNNKTDSLIKFKEVLSKISKYIDSEEHIRLIKKCYIIAEVAHFNQPRESGEPYISHPLAVIEELAEMKQDVVSICAGLLHDVIEDTPITDKKLKKLLLKYDTRTPELEAIVEEIVYLVHQVTKVKNENYDSKLITGSVKDLRVIVVKLADRLHNMRTLKFKIDPEKRKKKALETFNKFILWAKILGAYKIKYELEDLCFKEISPKFYQDLEELRTVIKYQYKEQLDNAQKNIDRLFPDKNLYYVTKIKNAYGMYKSKYPQLEENENKKEVTEEMLQDINVLNCVKKDYKCIKELVQLKIIAETKDDCFEIARELLKNYQNDSKVTDSVRDYITNSKKNLYQSFDFEIEGIQYQIRTEEMDLYNCYGCTYESYKKKYIDLPIRESLKKNINDCNKDGDILGKFQETATRKISVMVRNRNYYLPVGSTIVDLAYMIDSALPDMMNKVIVNNQSVRRGYVLQDGDLVDIHVKNREYTLKK